MAAKLLFWDHPNTTQLSYFIDRELRPDDMRRVGAHLKTCFRCRKKTSSLRRPGALLRRLTKV